jgi:LmbE family N-acetylglucosaminyl deacetylase
MLDLTLGLAPDAPLRLLCLGAHADDIEIGAGGTVRHLIATRPGRVDVRWVVFSACAERAAEAEASAAHFAAGARELQTDVQAFRESYFPDQWAEIKAHLHGVGADFEPHLVLTHHERDRHQDHRMLAELTWNAFRDQLVLEYEIPKYDGDLGRPNVFVPLASGVVEDKLEALTRFFPSQTGKPWFDSETFRATLRLRGLECNSPSRYAEAFHARKLRIV